MAKIERIELPVPFPPGVTNCYFIPDSIPTLIDTGIDTPETFQSLQGGLKKFGARIADIGRIILTHGHSDHAGSAGGVSAACKATVFVHERDKWWALAGCEDVRSGYEEELLDFFRKTGVPAHALEERTAQMLNRFKQYFTAASKVEWLKGGELFSFDRFDLKVLHTPGHTAGSICLLDQTDGVLLSGDTLIEGVVPCICADLKSPDDLPPYYGLSRYEKSLDLLDALPLRSVLPGHGKPFSNHRKEIERSRRHREYRKKRILEIFGSSRRLGSATLGMSHYEVAKQLFSRSFSGGAFFMLLSEARGCMEAMEKDGLLSVRIENKKRLYYLNR